MKKKFLALSIAMGLVGGFGTAQAVYVSPDGLGEVLLYPFFSVEGGNDTYVNIVNTTDEVKAVKVRFLEAMNSQEVLDFNLYLSPEDHWSAVITDDPDGDGAIMMTSDTSCTAPAIPAAGVAFRDFEYTGDSINGVERTREGYIEVIEQGVVTDPVLAAAATHAGGVPGDCAAIRSAWTTGGQWTLDPTDGVDVNAGGLYGYGVVINVADGTDASYDAVALNAFSGAILHSAPGSLNPSLAEADPLSTVFSGGIAVDFPWVGTLPSAGANAVSSLFMHSTVSNDYVLEPTISAGTDWVVNFPTKRFYVDTVGAPFDPFTNAWDPDTSVACETVGITYYDREERGITPEDIDFSPLPPGADPQALCYEVNVVTINESDVLHPSSRVRRNLEVDYDNGWMILDLTNPDPIANPTDRTLVSANGFIFNGLPALGFAVQKYVNGDVGGLLSNYAGSVSHKLGVSITPPAP